MSALITFRLKLTRLHELCFLPLCFWTDFRSEYRPVCEDSVSNSLCGSRELVFLKKHKQRHTQVPVTLSFCHDTSFYCCFRWSSELSELTSDKTWKESPAFGCSVDPRKGIIQLYVFISPPHTVLLRHSVPSWRLWGHIQQHSLSSFLTVREKMLPVSNYWYQEPEKGALLPEMTSGPLAANLEVDCSWSVSEVLILKSKTVLTRRLDACFCVPAVDVVCNPGF